jgi:hypothetical protein
MTTLGKSIFLTLSAFVVSGCVSGSGESAWQGTIEERDGVLWVSNPVEPLWAADESAGLRFELEQVFGVESEPEEAILAQIGGVAIDDAGNVYVTDRQDHRLVAFDRSGNVLWSAGREGEGPGEFQRAGGIAWDGDSTLYVDNNRTALSLWSTAGEYVGSERLVDYEVQRASVVDFFEPRVLVLSSGGDGAVGAGIVLLRVGEPPWQKLSDFFVDVADKPVTNQINVGVGVSIVGHELAVGDVDSYDIRFVDRAGRLTRVVSQPASHLPGVAQTEGAWGVMSFVSPPRPLPDGRLLGWSYGPVGVDDPDAELARRLQPREGVDEPPVSMSTLDLFDPDGRLLTSIRREAPMPDGSRPEIGSPRAIGPDGKLYTTVDDPFPHVRRYRVEIDEPR